MKRYFIDVLLNNYFCFKGRASRKEFWMFNLYGFAIAIAISFALQIFLSLIFSKVDIVKACISLFIAAAFTIPSLGIMARRLHDVGKSAWWILASLVPFVGLYVLYLCVLPGEACENEYGEKSVG